MRVDDSSRQKHRPKRRCLHQPQQHVRNSVANTNATTYPLNTQPTLMPIHMKGSELMIWPPNMFRTTAHTRKRITNQDGKHLLRQPSSTDTHEHSQRKWTLSQPKYEAHTRRTSVIHDRPRPGRENKNTKPGVLRTITTAQREHESKWHQLTAPPSSTKDNQ
jgi:hypothetical protein